MRVLIVGGVAGGASCAARLRRLDEAAEIHIFDRGSFVSFANCGLPYHVGDVIPDESALVVATPKLFESRFNIHVHIRHEAVSMDRSGRLLVVRDLTTGEERAEPYDKLVLSPGAGPIKPPLPGLDLPGVFSLRTIPDAHHMRTFIASRRPQHAVVVGAGFVGLEVAENLRERGLDVAVVELLPHVMPPLDEDLVSPIACAMRDAGIELVLGDGIARVERAAAADDNDDDVGGSAGGDNMVVVTSSGRRLPAGLVLLAIGVAPESQLARAAGLELGTRGTVSVDAQMRTSDPDVYAVGDVVQTPFVVTGKPMHLALAGPANRQGRVAAEAICGRATAFRGVQGTAVCGLFGHTIAMTGATVGALRRAGEDVSRVRAVHLHPGHHVGYYPGAHAVHMKLVFHLDTRRVLGLQAVGEEGVEKRVDVVAMAIQLGGTVDDLAGAELCYAPQFGAAKDPVNLAGMLASNVCAEDVELADWEAIDQLIASPGDEALARRVGAILDVREISEHDFVPPVPGSVCIPMCSVRARHEALLPRDRPVNVVCKEGQRAYNVCRLLTQVGYQPRLVSGGITTFLMRRGLPVVKYHTPVPGIDFDNDLCPMPPSGRPDA